ncbi:hypothetical protein MTO96_009954 [Rhipicephalus appendiculatus]
MRAVTRVAAAQQRKLRSFPGPPRLQPTAFSREASKVSYDRRSPRASASPKRDAVVEEGGHQRVDGERLAPFASASSAAAPPALTTHVRREARWMQ